MFGGFTQPWMLGDTPMRRDLRLLCRFLRQELISDGYAPLWPQIQNLRALALRHEAGDAEADRELKTLFRESAPEDLHLLLRVMGLFFDFANVSEELQRERVVRNRRLEKRLSDSLETRLKALRASEPSATRRRELLDGLEAEFVLTAHPTEAKRQTVRRILDRLRRTLRRLSDPDMTRARRAPLLKSLHEDVRALLRTDPLHPHRPEVLEELDRALYVSDALWKAVPGLVEPLERARGASLSPLRFGCWIGGDRDGHPHVTVDITRETLQRLRQRALNFHLAECAYMLDRLPMLCRKTASIQHLELIVDRAPEAFRDEVLKRSHSNEYFRRALRVIRARLRDIHSYRGGAELDEDLADLQAALSIEGLKGQIFNRLKAWRRRTHVFGLQFMRLDLRENSKGYRTLIRELLPLLGEDPARAETDCFDDLWDTSFPEPDEAQLREHLSERSLDLLNVTRLMQNWMRDVSPEGVGANVISMTHCVGDVLWVLWLHRLVAGWRGEARVDMPISPLFETIDDLHQAGPMLTELFRHPVYRAELDRQGGRQIVMVGYSDSAKDGGYLAACWALHTGQEAMQKVADAEGVGLTVFHGRGGALGRGGGPAARAIQALPPARGEGHIRMTEQGEVIADRFADPYLAHRHMEQILGGLLLHAAGASPAKPHWRSCMSEFANYGREAYLELFHHPGFAEYFRESTPISCIESLPIGSRPSRRHGAASLEDLRAIPYTFSWTQSRQLINAFYGLGTAWTRLNRAQRLLAIQMYREWPFFRSMIDNAELALTKCDPVIARQYAGLVKDPVIREHFGNAVTKEMALTQKAILAMTERPSLMADTAWLRRSVEIRKPFIDLLNHIQIELLRRQRDGREDDAALQRSLRLSVQGIAAGLRTTG
ncbi:MAG: phosphoenolpyruvate carboxylase [Verrucomicrobia bacterium]|nr:phosphoenolpyruvate carboxylase [Verrucomicrobiota bacterium]MCH8511881.1 phosphoenolpyruvate carboxylase [Kiritimatiellia bacterium]